MEGGAVQFIVLMTWGLADLGKITRNGQVDSLRVELWKTPRIAIRSFIILLKCGLAIEVQEISVSVEMLS